MSTAVLSTVVDYVHRESGVKQPPWNFLNSSAPAIPSGSRMAIRPTETSNMAEILVESAVPPADDPELRLPDRVSLAYAEYLGGSALFSGLTIGIPTVFSGLLLIPLTKYDEDIAVDMRLTGLITPPSTSTALGSRQGLARSGEECGDSLPSFKRPATHAMATQGRYTRPLKIAYVALILGNILHALAYKARFLYLILIGRIVCGFGFTGFMYMKRYCSDPRIIGIRRRTTLASWLVLGQAFGFSAGPFTCGVLYKVGFSNEVFNGYTSPGWFTASCWLLFAIPIAYLFQDVPKPQRIFTSNSVELGTGSVPPIPESSPDEYGIGQITARQWGVIVSNIPIFTAAVFDYTPYAAGNFIALGGIATLPFLLASVRYSPRFQDRATLAVGSALGVAGLLLMLALLAADAIVFGSFFICWVLVALGFNLASTCTLSLLSKQLPNAWNGRTSLAIQYSNYLGRVTGAVLGGAGVQMGMKNYVAVQLGAVGVGALLHLTFWKQLKAKTG
ncbi:major facilitator superfamily domain-containing protein [Mycena epipterygia]|nr:major facilitator superfamily domain-containing protein [Mycena epipterygia]